MPGAWGGCAKAGRPDAATEHDDLCGGCRCDFSKGIEQRGERGYAGDAYVLGRPLREVCGSVRPSLGCGDAHQRSDERRMRRGDEELGEKAVIKESSEGLTGPTGLTGHSPWQSICFFLKELFGICRV